MGEESLRLPPQKQWRFGKIFSEQRANSSAPHRPCLFRDGGFGQRNDTYTYLYTYMIFCIRLIACSKLLQGPHGQKGRMWAIVETTKYKHKLSKQMKILNRTRQAGEQNAYHDSCIIHKKRTKCLRTLLSLKLNDIHACVDLI